jgi:hypothetical protein
MINQQQVLHLYNNTTHIKNILHKDDDITHRLPVGYLDDTIWFGSLIDQINRKLTIANEFYRFAKVQINANKYKVLTKLSKQEHDTIKFTVNNQEINAIITPKNKGERILGLYINIHNKKTPTIKKGKQIVQSHFHMMKKKKLSHDHVNTSSIESLSLN